VEEVGFGYGTADGKCVAYGSARVNLNDRFIRLCAVPVTCLERKEGWTMVASMLTVETDEFGDETYKWDWPDWDEGPKLINKDGQPLDKVDEVITVIRKDKKEDDDDI